LYDLVKECLLLPQKEFILYLAPPVQILKENENFFDQCLTPASLVYFKWKEEEMDVKETYLLDTILSKAQDYPLMEVTAPAAKASEVEEAEEEEEHDATRVKTQMESTLKKDNQKLPKWLKLNRSK
jgi:hypothetical protein